MLIMLENLRSYFNNKNYDKFRKILYEILYTGDVAQINQIKIEDIDEIINMHSKVLTWFECPDFFCKSYYSEIYRTYTIATNIENNFFMMRLEKFLDVYIASFPEDLKNWCTQIQTMFSNLSSKRFLTEKILEKTLHFSTKYKQKDLLLSIYMFYFKFNIPRFGLKYFSPNKISYDIYEYDERPMQQELIKASANGELLFLHKIFADFFDFNINKGYNPCNPKFEFHFLKTLIEKEQLSHLDIAKKMGYKYFELFLCKEVNRMLISPEVSKFVLEVVKCKKICISKTTKQNILKSIIQHTSINTHPQKKILKLMLNDPEIEITSYIFGKVIRYHGNDFKIVNKFLSHTSFSSKHLLGKTLYDKNFFTSSWCNSLVNKKVMNAILDVIPPKKHHFVIYGLIKSYDYPSCIDKQEYSMKIAGYSSYLPINWNFLDYILFPKMNIPEVLLVENIFNVLDKYPDFNKIQKKVFKDVILNIISNFSNFSDDNKNLIRNNVLTKEFAVKCLIKKFSNNINPLIFDYKSFTFLKKMKSNQIIELLLKCIPGNFYEKLGEKLTNVRNWKFLYYLLFEQGKVEVELSEKTYLDVVNFILDKKCSDDENFGLKNVQKMYDYALSKLININTTSKYYILLTALISPYEHEFFINKALMLNKNSDITTYVKFPYVLCDSEGWLFCMKYFEHEQDFKKYFVHVGLQNILLRSFNHFFIETDHNQFLVKRNRQMCQNMLKTLNTLCERHRDLMNNQDKLVFNDLQFFYKELGSILEESCRSNQISAFKYCVNTFHKDIVLDYLKKKRQSFLQSGNLKISIDSIYSLINNLENENLSEKEKFKKVKKILRIKIKGSYSDVKVGLLTSPSFINFELIKGIYDINVNLLKGNHYILVDLFDDNFLKKMVNNVNNLLTKKAKDFLVKSLISIFREKIGDFYFAKTSFLSNRSIVDKIGLDSLGCISEYVCAVPRYYEEHVRFYMYNSNVENTYTNKLYTKGEYVSKSDDKNDSNKNHVKKDLQNR